MPPGLTCSIALISALNPPTIFGDISDGAEPTTFPILPASPNTVENEQVGRIVL